MTITKIKKSELNLQNVKSLQIGDEKIVICNVGGKYFACSNVCSHDDGELVSNGATLVSGFQLECPRHGARFDVTTGEAKRMPAVAPIKTYKVVERGDELEIEIEID